MCRWMAQVPPIFFYDKQGCRGPLNPCGRSVSEWISQSAHFTVILPLVEGWQRAMDASDRQCQRSQVEHQDHPMPRMMSSESDSTLPLVGSAPPSAAWMEWLEERGGHALRVPSSQPRGRPPKQCSAKDGAGNLPSSSLDRDGAGSDGYSTVRKAPSSHCYRRKWCGEK